MMFLGHHNNKRNRARNDRRVRPVNTPDGMDVIWLEDNDCEKWKKMEMNREIR